MPTVHGFKTDLSHENKMETDATNDRSNVVLYVTMTDGTALNEIFMHLNTRESAK
jgi:hypothetical protein